MLVRTITTLLPLAFLVGCSKSSPAPEDSEAVRPQQVTMEEAQRVLTDLAATVECDQRLPLDDDVWYWDRAVGSICEVDDEPTVRIFVYRTAGSASQVASETLMEADERMTYSDHILAFGDPDVVATLSEKNEDLPPARSAATQSAPETTTAEQEDLNFCVRAVASTALQIAEGENPPSNEVSEMETLYPGYGDLIRRISSILRNQGERPTGLAQESQLSQFGDPAKEMLCGEGDQLSW